MSLRINKDNIYCIIPTNKYGLSDRIDNFMENDFTIYLRAKIIKESLKKHEECFLFSRNGMHSGFSAILDNENKITIKFVYWFWDTENNPQMKTVAHVIPNDCENEFNDFFAICDHSKSSIDFYFNNKKIGTIEYNGLNKVVYTESLIWLGAGNMITTEEIHKNIGDFEYELLFGSNKKMDIKEIVDIITNYEEKYLEYNTYIRYPILNNTTPNKNNYKIFCNFNAKNKYKMWDITGIGNFFQLYIEGNIYY